MNIQRTDSATEWGEPEDGQARDVRWRPGRRRLAGLAVLTAAATGVGAGSLAGSSAVTYFAGAYVLVTVLALFAPFMIVWQVVGGQVLAGSLLLGAGGVPPALVVPVVAAVVVTAELLGAAARLDVPFGGESGDVLRPAAVPAMLGGAVAGAVLLGTGLPGPTGVLGVMVATVACVGIAAVLLAGTR